MSSSFTILEGGPGDPDAELSVEVRASGVGVSIWDSDDFKVVWFDPARAEHRAAMRRMIGILQQQLGLHSTGENDGQEG